MTAHRCYCVTAHSQPLELVTGPTLEPKGREVLIRVTGAGVCHSDIHIWEGQYDLGGGKKLELKDRGMQLPLTMGHEIVRSSKPGPMPRTLRSARRSWSTRGWVAATARPANAAMKTSVSKAGRSACLWPVVMPAT
jgi:hypothetical protein